MGCQSLFECGHIIRVDGNVRYDEVVIFMHCGTTFNQMQVDVSKSEPSAMPEREKESGESLPTYFGGFKFSCLQENVTVLTIYLMAIKILLYFTSFH